MADEVKLFNTHIKTKQIPDDVTSGIGGCIFVATDVIIDKPISSIIAREAGGTIAYAYRGVWREIFGNNTATGGSTTTIVFPEGYSELNDFYNGMFVYIKSGTGLGQVLEITDYVGATRTATFATATAPDATSVFRILEGEDVSVATKGNFAGVALIAGDYISPYRVPYQLVSIAGSTGGVIVYLAS